MRSLAEQRSIEITRLITFFHFHFATGYIFPGEQHPFWEMVYVIDGQVDIGADERVYALNPGDLIFHKPNEYHSIWANYAHAPNLMVLSFDCDSAAMRFFERRCIHTDERQRAYLNAVLEEAYTTYSSSLSKNEKTEREGHCGGGYTLRLLTTVLLMNLLCDSQLCAVAPAVSVSPVDPRDEAVMNEIVGYMKTNLCKELRLDMLCRHMKTSKTALKTLFRRNFSSSPIAYFERLRMMEAQKLMRQSSHSVSTIADMLGFSSASYFSTRFRRVTGQTPSAYRKELRRK